MMTLEELGSFRYVSLVTFRRDGREVATPVWIAQVEQALYVFSEAQVGKVKRIRANGRAKLAQCDFRGRKVGNYVEVSAAITTDPATVAAAYRALRKKYGWQMWLTDALSKLTGRYDARAILALRIK